MGLTCRAFTKTLTAGPAAAYGFVGLATGMPGQPNGKGARIAADPRFASGKRQLAQARIASISGPFGVRPRLKGAEASRHLA
ncbi:hypothetical protein GCM10008966_11660 [Rhodovulum strictum]